MTSCLDDLEGIYPLQGSGMRVPFDRLKVGPSVGVLVLVFQEVVDVDGAHGFCQLPFVGVNSVLQAPGQA